MERKFLKHIDQELFKSLAFDWILKTIPPIDEEKLDHKINRALTCTDYIEDILLSLGAEEALLLLFDFNRWYRNNVKAFLSLDEFQNLKEPPEDSFKRDRGVLVF